MASPSKAEKVKIWLREYLSEFGEYSGTLEELAHLANSTPYLVKKALTELEEEALVKAESKRGKGLVVALVEQKKEEKWNLKKRNFRKLKKFSERKKVRKR